MLADALSRGSPFDDLRVRPDVWRELERRFGPHDVDRYAAPASTCLHRFNSVLPCVESEGAPALAQSWAGVNNYVFAPPTELPRVAQLLHECPSAAATLIVPHWPAQAWFQRIAELATHAETRALSDVAAPPGWLPASAQHALSGAMLTFFRVPGHPGGSRRVA